MIKNIVYKILAFLFPSIIQYGPVEEKSYHYTQKKLLTQTEITFYKKLKKIENFGDYLVFPQINLAAIIEKSGKYRNELFRNVDFGIFNSNFDLLILIELNDKTHKNYNRRKRDLKVQEICQLTNIKLLTFYTSYPNEENYIINRIISEITSKTN